MLTKRVSRLSKLTGVACLLIVGTAWVIAQGPRMRRHTAVKAQELRLVEANQSLSAQNKVNIREKDSYRFIEVNSIPNHKVGAFPNRGNPHRIELREVTFRVPLDPKVGSALTSLELGFNFGVGINGILFDPGAAEYWQGSRQLGWQYEALGGAVPLGLDTNFAHVQPDGKYHYHGLPTGLLKELKVEPTQHSPLVGWAADGFPIYALYGFTDVESGKEAEIKEMQPSYRLREGNRPGGRNGPAGTYDGTFVNDYEYVEGLGDLDECNGRQCVTPEFPEGTYAYFLTQHWPTVPRKWRGSPDTSFRSGPGRGGPGFGPRGPRGEFPGPPRRPE